MPAPKMPHRSVFSYWACLIRFAVFRRLPKVPRDVLIWSMVVPYVHWKSVWRGNGRTFEDVYAGGYSSIERFLLPMRTMYLGFLFFWPILAAFRALSRGRGALAYWRGCLCFPELAMQHPKANYTSQEWAWSRPDYTLGMFYGYLYANHRGDYLRLEDKGIFMEGARLAGFPLPETLSFEQAQHRPGTYIVKDRHRDLGFGIAELEEHELHELEDEGDVKDLIIQPKLKNHPELRAIFPSEAPLSTLRVTTLLDPQSGEPKVSRCALRMGMDGALSDNTMQGGIWANIARDSGKVLEGVTKKTFGRYKGPEPLRLHKHPDSGKRFAGLKVPHFEQGCKMALAAHRSLCPEALSMGWDVALCDGDPVFLEVNVWTVVYDYDPPDDACLPTCELILARLP